MQIGVGPVKMMAGAALGAAVLAFVSAPAMAAGDAAAGLKAMKELNLIVLGDLNLPDRSGAYRQLTTRLDDAHREAGWGLGYTFPQGLVWGRFWVPFPFLRTDYVLHSPDIRALDIQRGTPSGSDHLPVVARLGLPG